MADKSDYKFNWVLTTMNAIPKFQHNAGELDNVLHSIEWHCEIYDPVDHSVHLEKGITVLDLDGINPENFTDFLELTKEQVCSWINNIEHVEERLVATLVKMKTAYVPQEPQPIQAPWLMDCCPDGKGMQG